MSKPDNYRIFTDPHAFARHLAGLRNVPYKKSKVKVTLASGGFDPCHIGHVEYIRAAASLDEDALMVVAVNSDEWLKRKKGSAFMNFVERATVIAALSGVDYVVGWDDGGPTVSGLIELIEPDIFAKGGDRDSPENVPEYEVCQAVGCKVVFGVGGGKVQSSSELIARANEANSSKQ